MIIAYTGNRWGGYGEYYNQDNDVTIVNNYNLDYNIEQGGGNLSTNITDTDWSSGANDDYYDGGDDF